MQTAIFEERDKWTGPILLSVGLHVLLVLIAILGGYFSTTRGHQWGGTDSGSAVPASLVSDVPLPRQQERTDNILANDSKGLTQSVRQKAQPELNAIPIPDKNLQHKQTKTANTQAPDIRRPITPPRDNTVPYGQGGPIDVSYSTFTIGQVNGGFKVDPAFGDLFKYYVAIMGQKINQNWHPDEIGPIGKGHRAFLSYDVSRNGTLSNIHLEQSSSIPALDQSAQRALDRIKDEGFGPLPDAYRGSYLHVTLWFEPPR